jgi:hypothetical protein
MIYLTLMKALAEKVGLRNIDRWFHHLSIVKDTKTTITSPSF